MRKPIMFKEIHFLDYLYIHTNLYMHEYINYINGKRERENIFFKDVELVNNWPLWLRLVNKSSKSSCSLARLCPYSENDHGNKTFEAVVTACKRIWKIIKYSQHSLAVFSICISDRHKDVTQVKPTFCTTPLMHSFLLHLDYIIMYYQSIK